MPVLILTSENAALEREVAKKVAQQMDYSMLDHHFLDKIADKYSIDRKKLADAMVITPSILKRMPAKAWNYYLSCVELEVLEQLLDDNFVCCGLGAHLYVIGVSHVLKVRLIGGHGLNSASDEDQKNNRLSQKLILDQESKNDKWSMEAFKRKSSDANLYDMVMNMDQMPIDEAIENLTTTLDYPRFKPMTYSKNNLLDMTLAARVKNVLLKTLTDIHVTADNGTVVVTTTSVKREKNKKIETIKQLTREVPGISYIEVHWNKDIMAEASTSFR